MNKSRINKGLTQRELGKLSNIDTIRISELELGFAAPTSIERTRLNKILGECSFANKKEAEKNKKKEDKFFDALIKTIDIIKKEGKEKGSINCLLCGKKLSFIINDNGHIWGKCETQNCLSWIQ